MKVKKLIDHQRKAAVNFMKFTRMKSKYDSTMFFCFEGDDIKYYGLRFERYLNYSEENRHYFDCGGKKEVIDFYRMVNKDDSYKNVKIAYFVDLDFDESIKTKIDPPIYETPCYSIENLYVSVSAFKKILRREFLMNEADRDFKTILKLFKERQEEFHDKTKLLNAWIACQREDSSSKKDERIDLTSNSSKITKFIPTISLSSIVADYDVAKLESIFEKATKLTDERIDKKIKEQRKNKPIKCFRGKYEIHFLFEMINALREDIKKDKPIYFKIKRKGVQINISKSNIISELSQYADTPQCLVTYINSFN